MTTIAIVGAGNVGATVAFACLLRGTARRVVLHDIDAKRVRAQVLDLRHGLPFVPHTDIDGSDDLAVCAGADIVVHTAGAKQEPGQSRLDLAATNVALHRELVPRTVAVAPDALQLVVSNPVDVVTEVATRVAGLRAGRVFGTGTVLDSARFRELLAGRLGVSSANVHASIAGEHGDSEVALWSNVSIGGVPLDAWPGAPDASERAVLRDAVAGAAYEIIEGKGATAFAIGVATARICEAVLRDEHRVMAVTARVHGVAGMGDVCLALPRLVGRAGVSEPLPVAMSDDELAALHRSAATIRSVLAQLGF
jgi:L-lactate dehydrogenase